MKITDKMRMDWLEKTGSPCGIGKGSGFHPNLKWKYMETPFGTLREAIDAAIRDEKKRKEGA